MLITTKTIAKTTDSYQQLDCLSDVLQSMKIHGSVLLNEDYALPWAVSIPSADTLGGLLEVGTSVRVVAFHFARRGHFQITLTDGPEASVEAGELVICFTGVAHHISCGPKVRPVAVEKLLMGGRNVFKPSKTNIAGQTSLTCGVFLLHDTHLNPLFSALPPLLHVSAGRESRFHNVHRVADLMAHEMSRPSLGGRYVIDRLLELLCTEAVRSHMDEGVHSEMGWFRGLKDPTIGRALGLIHAQPGEAWSIKQLAQAVAMSPSRFAARFASALGESPMAYVTKWRMNLAARLLVNTDQGLGSLATHVGYDNVAAFSRAFKKHMGIPPAAWRAR